MLARLMLRPAFSPRRGEQHLVEKLVREIEIADTAADADHDRDNALQRRMHGPLP
jgi:hypothetical protein